jgi:spore germination cell wall hydrolase CwlJ-like protein
MNDTVKFITSSAALACLMLVGVQLTKPDSYNPQEKQYSIAPLTSEQEYEFRFNSGAVEGRDEYCYRSNQCRELAEAVFFEARGEPIKGQYAVAFTVINRRDHHRWPDTVYDVVHQRIRGNCQYSYVCELTNNVRRKMIAKNPNSWATALEVAFDAYYFEVEDLTDGADHYYNPRKVRKTPKFAKVYDYVATIGDHEFYKSNH